MLAKGVQGSLHGEQDRGRPPGLFVYAVCTKYSDLYNDAEYRLHVRDVCAGRLPVSLVLTYVCLFGAFCLGLGDVIGGCIIHILKAGRSHRC